MENSIKSAPELDDNGSLLSLAAAAECRMLQQQRLMKQLALTRRTPLQRREPDDLHGGPQRALHMREHAEAHSACALRTCLCCTANVCGLIYNRRWCAIKESR